MDEGKPFRADACYEIKNEWGGGYLFIEHNNTQTGLNNLVKYWKIIAEKKFVASRIFIEHIIDNKHPAASRLCRFVGDRFVKDQRNVNYYLREVSDWHNSEWKDRLEEVLKDIIESL